MTIQTIFWTWTEESIQAAALLLKQQEVVAFPTETVYGLGADASSETAVAKIFVAKGRPADNPLIVHVADKEQISKYVTMITPSANKIIDAFMPGPITVILPSNGSIAKNVTAGLSTVGIRIPDHEAARSLIKQSGLPIAAPSANISGKPSPTSALHVYQDLQGKIAGILDGGTTGIGVESTVVDCTGELPVILRPGGISCSEIERITDMKVMDATTNEQAKTPKSPGMKYNHYEPDVPLGLIYGSSGYFQMQITHYQQAGKKVGVIASEELAGQLAADQLSICGSQSNLATVATHLYGALRSFKRTDVDIILAETFPEDAVGQAIMNRLTKAASIIHIEEKDNA